jgi:hypothetical protein
MGIKNHLQALAGIGDTERFTAVTETEMGYLHFYRNTAQLHVLITPVELEGVTGIKLQGDEGVDYCRTGFSLPGADVTTYSIITAGVPLPLQLLMMNDNDNS